MAKSLSSNVEFHSRAKYKHTRQGSGKRSKPRKGKKAYRGQGR